MFHKKVNQDEQGLREINMTPLIDVSLVLVVMLLLATPLTFESSIAVNKSVTSSQTAERTIDEKRIELRGVSEDSVKVNRSMVARAALVETLRPLIEANGSPSQVVVACADNVSHRAFVNVLDKAKVCGATEIAVMGR